MLPPFSFQHWQNETQKSIIISIRNTMKKNIFPIFLHHPLVYSFFKTFQTLACPPIRHHGFLGERQKIDVFWRFTFMPVHKREHLGFCFDRKSKSVLKGK